MRGVKRPATTGSPPLCEHGRKPTHSAHVSHFSSFIVKSGGHLRAIKTPTLALWSFSLLPRDVTRLAAAVVKFTAKLFLSKYWPAWFVSVQTSALPPMHAASFNNTGRG